LRQLRIASAVEAADHVSGWLRLVALQHTAIFTTYPFEEEVVKSVLNHWQVTLSTGLHPRARKDLTALIGRLHLRLTQRPTATVRALFIGDCLIWDIATQAQIAAHSSNFDIEPTVVAKRVGADLRRSLQALSPDQFDIVFYSPFSFGFSENYAQYTDPSRIIGAVAKGAAPLREALADVQKTIALLHNNFECALYVHTVSGVRQNRAGIVGRVANLSTWPLRRWAAGYLNAQLSAFIEGLAAAGDKHRLRRIDEAEPLMRVTDLRLGQTQLNAGELHPTLLAKELANGPYLRAGMAAAHLKKRKLIICDLDNTLWDGVIGDGPVEQHRDRQKAVLRLKAKGVLLAVSSKNDPANVRWDEALISPEDFVALEINWGRKAMSIRTIADALNLNPNSFVFLDDRPDERATVMEELPGLLALDPNEPETWKLMDEWAAILGGAALMDRTAMYKDRMERQAYLSAQQDADEAAAEAYRKLDLRLNLRHPTAREMGRVIELINRTNQFNTTAARTTMHELAQLAPRRHIMVAAASDKFGDMGIVGVLVVTDDDAPRISHFVLSCRVFGFGIENAMVQSVLNRYADKTLTAQLVKTPSNGPCQNVFASNGFVFDGKVWMSQGSLSDVVQDWLTINDSFVTTPATLEVL
jgi:FkbH-like protein